MASLLTIPSNILWDYLIVGMLSVRDLALLDMAMANHKLRQSLKIFEDLHWTSSHPIELPSSALHWLCHRNIGVSSLVVTPTFLKVFQHIKTSLSSFSLSTARISNVDVNSLRVSITFLRTLEISKDLKQLKLLKLGKASSNSDAEKLRVVQHIHKVRPNLSDFHLFECDEDIPALLFNLFTNLQRIVIIRGKVRAAPTSQTPPTTPTTTTNHSIINHNGFGIEGKRLFTSVKTVELDGLTSSLVHMISACPSLTRLVIATNDLTEQILNTLLSNCPALKDLRIEGPVSEDMCRSIASYGSQLRDLHLLSNRPMTITQGKLLSPVIPALSWFIWHSTSIDEGAMQVLLPKKCPNMRTLQLGRGTTNVAATRDTVQISINDLRTIMDAFPNLTALFIPYCLRPGDEALQAIANLGSTLLGLVTHLDGCISGNAMGLFLISCGNIQTMELHASSLSGEAMLCLSRYGGRLRDLIVHSSHAFPSIDRSDAETTSAYDDSCLCTCGSDRKLFESSKISWEVNPLRAVKGQNNYDTGKGRCAKCDLGKVKLRSLELCGPGAVDLPSLCLFIDSFVRINELKLTNIPLREVAGVDARSDMFLSRCSGGIGSIRIENIDSLSDRVFMKLMTSPSMRGVQQLRIRTCPRITALSMGTVAGSMSASDSGGLRTLSYYDCENISDNAMADIANIFPHIKICHKLDADF